MSDVEHDALPLPDYDHHTTGSLESHVQRLGAEDVEVLIAYERDHGGRVPMLNVLERRLEALRGGAEPTGDGEPAAPGPETAEGTSGGSKVDPSTSGPPLNPPSHGDPTNPAQPRT
jgi:hypothetical protein